jgi:hypothetical protein
MSGLGRYSDGQTASRGAPLLRRPGCLVDTAVCAGDTDRFAVEISSQILGVVASLFGLLLAVVIVK